MSPASQILLLPLRRWLRRRTLMLAMVLLAALLLLPSVLQSVGAGGRTARVMTPVTGVILLSLLWTTFVGAVLSQNTAHTARLVPGHLRQLRLALGGGWLLAVVPLCLLAGWLLGWSWALQLALALGLLLLAVTVRFPWLWAVLWVLPSFWWWWARLPAVRDTLAALQAWAAAQPLTALLATLAAGLLVLPTLLPSRGHAPRPRSSAADGWNGRPRNEQVPAPLLALGRWVRYQATHLYRWQLRSLCAQPPRAPMARALLVLGSTHWTSQATAAIVVVLVNAVVVGALYAVGVVPWPNFDRSQLLGAALGLMSFAINPLAQAAGLLRSRREQALLMLVPGLPRGPALSRALALRLSLHFGISWALASVLALAMVGLQGQASQVVQAVVFGTLPFVALLWRDWSRLPPQGGGRVTLVVGAVVGAVLLLAWGLKLSQPPWPLTAALSVLLTVALLAWRWRRLGQLPQAWPTGWRAA